MIPNDHTAGICGIFCGTCPMYPTQCEGCLSDNVAAPCRVCPNNFRTCASDHGATRCFECAEFPCARLEDFRDSHWENGISHHVDVISHLKRMKADGVSVWVAEETAKARCPHCESLTPWNKHQCDCKA